MSVQSRHRWAVARVAGFSLWLAIVAIVLLSQATSYRGVMAVVGEWQFNSIGREYPTFNYTLLVFLLCLPGYLIFLKPRRRSSTELAQAATLRSARLMMKVLGGVGLGLVGAATVVFVLILMLPGREGVTQQIDLASQSPSPPVEGPTALSGTILYERTAGFDEDLLLTRRTYRFAPIVAKDGSGEALRYFVQFPPVDDRSRSGLLTVTGVLQRNGLPGELARLFRYAGFEIDDPHYVLFLDPAAMRWPYLVALVQLIIGALVVGGLLLLQRQRLRRIDRLVHARTVGSRPS